MAAEEIKGWSWVRSVPSGLRANILYQEFQEVMAVGKVNYSI